MRIVVGITGASGVQYAYRLLLHLQGEAMLVMTPDGRKVIEAETTLGPGDFEALAQVTYDAQDFTAPVASGSAPFDALVIVPCSMNTLAKVALGLADNLVTRAASVALKEGRRLILVPRETPLHVAPLEHLLKAAQMGATVLPAMPGFYHRPKEVNDLVDFVVARVLDHLGVAHDLIRPWGDEAKKPLTPEDG